MAGLAYSLPAARDRPGSPAAGSGLPTVEGQDSLTSLTTGRRPLAAGKGSRTSLTAGPGPSGPDSLTTGQDSLAIRQDSLTAGLGLTDRRFAGSFPEDLREQRGVHVAAGEHRDPDPPRWQFALAEEARGDGDRTAGLCHQPPLAERITGIGGEFRLDADDPGGRAQRLDRRGYARDQAATADRAQDE